MKRVYTWVMRLIHFDYQKFNKYEKDGVIKNKKNRAIKYTIEKKDNKVLIF